MRQENWHRVKDIFAEALDEPSDNRLNFLRQTCGGDEELFAEVLSLLEAGAETELIIEENKLNLASKINTNRKYYNFSKFGHYTTIREIGRGGMGAVFLAERNDGEFKQFAALKIINQGSVDAEIERHFRRERQILASLNHPNIARLLDGGVSETGELFFVMEYIEGEPLLEFADNHQLNVEERLRLFLKICHAVSYAHQNLVIHRDIKPANILVTNDGEPKLLDFGLAKLTEPNEISSGIANGLDQTKTLFRAFTPAYASPEQIHGKAVTTASDVYSLGVVLYEMLTGEKPLYFENKSFEEILHLIDTLEPPRPSSVVASKSRSANFDSKSTTANGTVQTEKDYGQQSQFKIQNSKSLHGDLDNIILVALRKEMTRRYSSVEAFADDIERHLNGLPISARPNTIGYRASKFFQRNRIAVTASVFVLLALISGLAIALWQAKIARAERDRAERRFGDVRQLSNALLNDIAPKIERLEGSTEARQALVEQSLIYLDSLAAESADDLVLQAELAAAYEKVGVLQGDSRKPSLSDFRGAIASLEKAQDIRRRLLKINPQEAENRRLLAENLRLLALRKMTQNDVEGGFKNSAEALQIYEKLVAEQPDKLDLQKALLEAQTEDATSYINRSRYAEAIPPLRLAASKLEELHRMNAGDTEIERILAKSLVSLGVALSWESRQPEAEAEMTRAVAIAESLVARFQNDTNLKQDLWKFYESASGIYEEIDDARAFELCEKSRRVVEKIIAADPVNAQARHNLSKSFSRLGISASNLGKHAEAISYLEQAITIILELQQKDPLNRGYDRDVSILHIRLGVTRTKQRDFPAALAAFQKGAESFEKQLAEDAANTVALRDSAIAYRHAGVTYKELAKNSAGQTRQTYLSAEKENYQKALDALLKADAQKALPEVSRQLIEQYKKDIEKLEKLHN